MIFVKTSFYSCLELILIWISFYSWWWITNKFDFIDEILKQRVETGACRWSDGLIVRYFYVTLREKIKLNRRMLFESLWTICISMLPPLIWKKIKEFTNPTKSCCQQEVRWFFINASNIHPQNLSDLIYWM